MHQWLVADLKVKEVVLENFKSYEGCGASKADKNWDKPPKSWDTGM